MILVEIETVGVDERTLDGSIIRGIRIDLVVDVLMRANDMAAVRLEEVVLIRVVVLTKRIKPLVLIKVAQRISEFVVCNASTSWNIVIGTTKVVIHAHVSAHGEIRWVDTIPTFMSGTELLVTKRLIHAESALRNEAVVAKIVVLLFDIWSR